MTDCFHYNIVDAIVRETNKIGNDIYFYCKDNKIDIKRDEDILSCLDKNVNIFIHDKVLKDMYKMMFKDDISENNIFKYVIKDSFLCGIIKGFNEAFCVNYVYDEK